MSRCLLSSSAGAAVAKKKAVTAACSRKSLFRQPFILLRKGAKTMKNLAMQKSLPPPLPPILYSLSHVNRALHHEKVFNAIVKLYIMRANMQRGANMNFTWRVRFCTPIGTEK